MRIDMHIHSCYSHDAVSKPETIVKTAKEKNLVALITDHGNCKAWAEISKYAKQYDVPFILGEEIKVYDNGKMVGELLGYFMDTPLEKGEYPEVIDKLRAQDALISVAHPFDTFRKPFRRLEEVKNRVDAIEIFNARGYWGSFNKKTRTFVEKNSLHFTAGSDAHFPEEIGNAYIELEASGLEEARKLIKKGRVTYYGKLAPFTVHIKTQLAKRGIIKPM